MKVLESEKQTWPTGINPSLALILALLLWLPGCASTVPEATGDPPRLACEQPTGIERALPPDFSGYQTPEKAARAWSATVEIPEGTWNESESGFMILVDDDGHAVVRASISTMIESASATFDEKRFVSPSIDFCDPP